MVDQGILFRLTRVQRLLQRIEHEVGPHRAAYPPADDTSSKDVDDEGNVHETLPCRDVREIADPKLVWPLRLELAIDPVERARRLCIGNRRAYDLASHDASQAGLAHQALHRAAGHICALTPQLAPNLVGSIDLHVRLPDSFDVDAQHVVTLDPCTTQLGIAPLRGVTPVAGRRDLHHPADRLDAVSMAVLVMNALTA